MINTPLPIQTTKAPGSLFDIDKLDALLADLESEHENLLTLAGQQRDALSRADAKGLGQVIEQTADTLSRIANIEHSRQRLIKNPNGSVPTVKQITDELHEQNNHALANTLTDRSKSLRKLMLQVNDEHDAVRQATLALSDHMNGLMRQVSATLSHTGTYGRRGAVDPSRAQVTSMLDTIQ